MTVESPAGARYILLYRCFAYIVQKGGPAKPEFRLRTVGFGNVVEYCTEDDAAIRRICVTADDVFDQIEALEQRLL